MTTSGSNPPDFGTVDNPDWDAIQNDLALRGVIPPDFGHEPDPDDWPRAWVKVLAAASQRITELEAKLDQVRKAAS